ncbi:MAG: type II toxin-antitoxin system Phd/YefM family antitoxin [bacterium]
MKEISVLNDIVPLGEFKAELSKWMRSVQQSGQPVIITQNGRPAGVLLSPKDFDELRQSKLFIDSVRRGVDDASSGRVFDTERLRQELEKRRQKRLVA